MMKLNLLSAALITAAVLTTPAQARQSQLTSRRLTANANAHNATTAHNGYEQACCRNRPGDLANLADRDVWGHWGAYYGPMVHVH
jgi:hypothetical protein